MKKFIIASNNAKKLKELERILTPLDICVTTAKKEGISLEEVEETGTTFAQNAKLKAMNAFENTKLPSIADDSGLMVKALNNAPGVYSARYAGENATDKDRINKLLLEMKETKKEDRGASFACAICCVIDKDTVIEVYAECKGEISFEIIGDGGFGYDPVFLTDSGKSFAQLSSCEKDEISHRGNALRLLKKELLKYYSQDK